MQKTITVKGVGRVLAKPDFVVISMEFESQEMEYEDAMALETKRISSLTDALVDIGFNKKDLKTTNFDVHTDYRYEKDSRGNSKKYFDGYVVGHNLKLSFDFDTARLSKILTTISSCPAEPDLSIQFTIKDTTVVNEEMLRIATVNAREKAEILCDAAGARLGELITIDYNWGEVNFVSGTRYLRTNEMMVGAKGGAVDFTPDDIDVSDTATFIWEIS